MEEEPYDRDNDDDEEIDQRRISLSSEEEDQGVSRHSSEPPLEYNDLFMQPIKMKAGDLFFKPKEANNTKAQTTLKSSTNSDRYKQPEESGEQEELGAVNDYEDDEYGDEIIDLGDDVQPFSMQFKLDKPIIEAVKPEKT